MTILSNLLSGVTSQLVTGVVYAPSSDVNPITLISSLTNYIQPDNEKTYSSGTTIETIQATGSEADTFTSVSGGVGVDYDSSLFNNIGGFVSTGNNSKLYTAQASTEGWQFGMIVDMPLNPTLRPHLLGRGTGLTNSAADAELINLETDGSLRWFRNEAQGNVTVSDPANTKGKKYVIYINARTSTEWDFYFNGILTATLNPDNSYLSYQRWFFGGGTFNFGEFFICNDAHNALNDPSISDINNYLLEKYSVPL